MSIYMYVKLLYVSLSTGKTTGEKYCTLTVHLLLLSLQCYVHEHKERPFQIFPHTCPLKYFPKTIQFCDLLLIKCLLGLPLYNIKVLAVLLLYCSEET